MLMYLRRNFKKSFFNYFFFFLGSVVVWYNLLTYVVLLKRLEIKRKKRKTWNSQS